VASLCIILAQEMRGADDEAAGPGHASRTLLCAGLQGGSQYVVGYIGSPGAIPAADEGCQWSMSLRSRRSLAEARIALGSFDRFLLLYGAMFAAFGVASPFLPALLHQRGLGPSEIGAVLAAGTAVRLITGPVISRLADRLGKHRQILAVLLAMAGVIAFGYSLPAGFAIFLLVSVAHASALAPIVPIADAMTLAAAPGRFEYGGCAVRRRLPLSWALGALVRLSRRRASAALYG